MDNITITIPKYAARYLIEMCKQHRKYLGRKIDKDGYSIQDEASFDSINQIECAIPRNLE